MHRAFSAAPLLADVIKRYAFFRYDSLTVRIVTNSSKESFGGMITCVVPTDNNSTVSDIVGLQPAVLYSTTPNSCVTSFSDPLDVTYEVPWSYRQQYISSGLALSASEVTFRNAYLGSPNLYGQVLSCVSVSGRLVSIPLLVFVQFNGMKLFGPCATVSNQMRRSTSNPVTNMLATSATAMNAAWAVKNLYDYSSDPAKLVDDILATSESKNLPFEEDKCFRPNYFGDLSCVPSNTHSSMMLPHVPTFDPLMYGSARDLPLSDYFQRPQLIDVISTASLTAGVVIPVSPIMHTTANRSVAGNWFTFFGKFARYWSGTLNLHFMIFSHPLTEYRVRTTLLYKSTLNTNVDFATNDTNVVTCGGDSVITVPVPFLTDSPRLRLAKNWTDLNSYNSCCSVKLQISAITSATTNAGAVACYMFMSGGPDLTYYAPTAFTPYSTIDSAVARDGEVLDQCRLPGAVVQHHIPARNISALHDVLPLYSVQQLCSVFSLTRLNLLFDDGMVFMSPCLKNNANDKNFFGLYDNLAWMASFHMFWRGAIDFKVSLDIDAVRSYDGVQDGIFYVANEPALPGAFLTPGTANSGPFLANPCTGVAMTWIEAQPVIDFSLPMRSFYAVEDVAAPGSSQAVFNTNIVDADLIYRRAGPGFQLLTETFMPPASMWVNNGFVL